jgi:GGDEF domain-containing protein
MTGQPTAKRTRLTEHHKARARVVLLTLIGLVCPPLAGVRSVAVWIFYIAFLVAYSLWSLRLTRNFSGDRRLGYLLCATDTAILLPVLVWTSTASIRGALLGICAVGLLASYWADCNSLRRRMQIGTQDEHSDEAGPAASRTETGLERALRVRLQVYQSTHTRFALVVLRMVHFEDINSYYGQEASDYMVSIVTRRCLRLLGADAQDFVLPGGRVALVFSTGSGSTRAGLSDNTFELIDPYDIESFAMTLARKACEHLIDGHRAECVVGWAAAPADGLTPDDLMYAAESGAQSAAAFRRVAGSGVTVPEQARRVAAG